MVCIPLGVAAGYKALSYQSLLTVVAAHRCFGDVEIADSSVARMFQNYLKRP